MFRASNKLLICVFDSSCFPNITLISLHMSSCLSNLSLIIAFSFFSSSRVCITRDEEGISAEGTTFSEQAVADSVTPVI